MMVKVEKSNTEEQTAGHHLLDHSSVFVLKINALYNESKLAFYFDWLRITQLLIWLM